MAEKHKTIDKWQPSYEYKMLIDSDEDIDDTRLTEESTNGWHLVQYVNSRQGRPKDRYYFRRFKNS